MWEYKLISGSIVQMVDDLNAYGQEGWCVAHIEWSNPGKFDALLERDLDDWGEDHSNADTILLPRVRR